MILTLGEILKKNQTTGERALKELLLKEGIGFIPGKFPLAWAKEIEGGVEIISFYPSLPTSPALWVGREMIANEKSSKTLLIDSIHEETIESSVHVPVALFKNADVAEVKIQYKKITLLGKTKRTFASPQAEISFLFSHPEVTYVTYQWAQSLYYHLGFPLKKFDNLGNFWKNGTLFDLVSTAYKKIA